MFMFKLKAFIVLLFTLYVLCRSECDSDVSPNNSPIYTDPPVLVNTTKNGKLYVVGVESNTLRPMHVLHTWGTPYEMGFAHGVLLKEQVATLNTQMYKHIDETIDEYLHFLSPGLRKKIEEYGLAFVLELTYLTTRWYTPDYWEEEMRGLSDASGVPFKKILHLHMLPELIKAGCSMFTAYGAATPKGDLLQLRALDWDMKANLQTLAVVHVRHPNEDGSWGHSYATLGWAGWLSGLTGMSSNGMGISEKYGNEVFGGDSRIGYPFNYVMRDVIQFDKTLEESIYRLQTTKRTCSIYLGVGDQKVKSGRIFQYSSEQLNIWDDKTQRNNTDHPQLNNVVYQGVRSTCYHERLKMYSSKGQLTAENTIRNIVSYSKTGDVHSAIYDFGNNYMYISNAAPLESTEGPTMAYERSFMRLNMTELFGDVKPRK